MAWYTLTKHTRKSIKVIKSWGGFLGISTRRSSGVRWHRLQHYKDQWGKKRGHSKLNAPLRFEELPFLSLVTPTAFSSVSSLVELVVVRTLVRVIGGAAVVVTVRFRAVVLGTPGLCSVSDLLNATTFGLSTCFVDAGWSIRQACSMIRNERDLFRSCGFMCM